jgi:putative membrane protein
MGLKQKFKLSVASIWLFTISGMLGILTEEYSEWFLDLTPLNLLLTFGILLWNIKSFSSKYIIAFSVPFVLGFVTEALGVNYGLIFGNYAYGDNLGYKIVGVPIMICFNWALLTAATADIAGIVSKNSFITALIGASLMTALDLLLEISAPRFDFWEFDGGTVPLQNYIGWFATAFLAHLGYQYFKVKTDRRLSWHIIISITLFFAIFTVF